MIIPIFKGAGIKIKVIDALSYNVPMIISKLGAQGIFKDDILIPITDNPRVFEKYMDKLISDRNFCEKWEKLKRSSLILYMMYQI